MEFEDKLECSPPQNPPMVGVEFKPFIRLVRRAGGKWCDPPEHKLKYSWFREQIFCSVHCAEIATIQCIACVTLKLSVRKSYHCSTKCFLNAWKSHLARHRQATETVSRISKGDGQALRRLRTCGSWPSFDYGSSFITSSIVFERDEKAWINVGSSETYVPSMDDFGLTLRLEFEAVDRLGRPLVLPNVILTAPVVLAPSPQPRYMIRIGPVKFSRNLKFSTQSTGAATFSVLSYNIFCDMYCNISKKKYPNCPEWALTWEYRRQNLLQEIIGYNADILCLQEVQSDHFENFFKPELTKLGYSVSYLKKTKENQMYTGEQYIIDGCATFYRRDRFNAINETELKFDESAASLVDMLDLEPSKSLDFRTRLMKGNIALVLTLELLANSNIHDAFQSRICVANTHIYADPGFPDVKLLQVTQLINFLETFAPSTTPYVICSDMNSLPGSDPHKFVVHARVNPVWSEDTLNIYQHLNLQHGITLVSAYSSLVASKMVEKRELQKMNLKENEPVFTTLTKKPLKKKLVGRTLDYIFYSGDKLKVEGLLELLDIESVGSGLPSERWSSDHIALMAKFSIPSRQPMYPLLPPHSYSCQQVAAW